MPFYLFQNPETQEVQEIFFHMNDEKVYIDESKIEWKRIYTVPQASIDTQADPFSSNDYVKVTNKKGGTYGDLLDKAAEMSKKREEKMGVDPVKEKVYKEYSEKRHGLKHPDQKKREANEKLKKLGVSIN